VLEKEIWENCFHGHSMPTGKALALSIQPSFVVVESRATPSRYRVVN
jgi:hypothetical protein